MKCLQFKLNRRALESLYFSFIRPTMEYASVVWGGCTQSDQDLLESIQLAAARVVTGALSHTSHIKLYAETGWETLAERRRKHRLTLMYKIMNGATPAYLQNLIPQTVSERTRYNIRSRHDITSFYARTNIFRLLFGNGTFFHILLKIPNIWTNLRKK